MAQEIGVVRIDVIGPMRSRNLRSALSAIEQCHSGLFLLDEIVEETQRFGYPRSVLWPRSAGFVFPIEDLYYRRSLSEFIPLDAELVLAAVEFASPGFIEIIGALNPLESIRKYLNDRQERKKDKDYRNAAEEDRLNLENEGLRLENERRRLENEGISLENERFRLENEWLQLVNQSLWSMVLNERIQILREEEVPRLLVNALVRELVIRPFGELDIAQDSGVLQLASDDR